MRSLKLERQLPDIQGVDRVLHISPKLLVLHLGDPELFAKPLVLDPQISLFPGMPAAARLTVRAEIGKADRDKQTR